METWDRSTTRRLDRATQIRVVDPGSPGRVSGFPAVEMGEQSIDGERGGVRLTSYSILMCMLQSSRQMVCAADGAPRGL